MNKKLDTMLYEAEGRYLSDEESARLQSWAGTLEDRLECMRAVERVETEVVNDVVNEVFRIHPEFESRFHQARERGVRDIGMVLRYCVMAMLREDEEMLKERMLYWFVTIAWANGLGPYMDTTYKALPRRLERSLDRQHIEMLAPYLRTVHNVMTSASRAA